MSDIEKVYQLLKQLQATFGIVAVLIIAVFGIALFLFWKFLLKRIELVAQKSFEKNLAEIKVKTQKRYEKQLEAIHECYSILQKVNTFAKYLEGNYRLAEEIPPQESGLKFTQLRNEFYDRYIENRIVFALISGSPRYSIKYLK